MENQSESPTQPRRDANTSTPENNASQDGNWSLLVVAIAVSLAVLLILTSVGNFLVCRTVWVCRRLRIPPFYLLASLSVSDFLLGLFVVPVSLAYHITYQTTGRWIFGEFTCNLWLCLNFILCSASIFNLCAVSGDRFFAVTSPLNYVSRINGRRVKQVVGVAWFCALTIGGFVTYGINASKDNTVECSIWGIRFEFVLVILIAGYILPVMFLVFVNGKVFFIARSHMSRIHAQEISLGMVTEMEDSTGGRERSAKSRLRHEIKIFKTFLVVTCTFLFSWTPFVVILVMDSLVTVPELVRHSSIIILYINSAMNPFIYGFFNSEFRRALMESFRCKCTPCGTRIGSGTEHAQKKT